MRLLRKLIGREMRNRSWVTGWTLGERRYGRRFRDNGGIYRD